MAQGPNSDESESEEEEDDEMGELTSMDKAAPKGRRTSVSAESLDPHKYVRNKVDRRVCASFQFIEPNRSRQ